VAGRSIYSQSEPFIELAGRPLIWYTLNEVQKSVHLEKAVVITEDEKVLEYAKQFPSIEPIKRPAELAKYDGAGQQTLIYALEYLRERMGYIPEAVCSLYITTPLRRFYHIDKAIDTLTIFDVDTVISVQEELSYCYFHRRHGLVSLSRAKRQLKVERDAVFKENGAIYLSRYEISNRGDLIGKRIGHITMLPEESIKINSEFELWLAEKIIRERGTRNR